MIKKLGIFSAGVVVGILGKVIVDNYFYKMLDEELDKEFEDMYDDLIDDEIDDEVEAEDSETVNADKPEAVEVTMEKVDETLAEKADKPEAVEVTMEKVDDILVEKADKPVTEISTEEENKEKEV